MQTIGGSPSLGVACKYKKKQKQFSQSVLNDDINNNQLEGNAEAKSNYANCMFHWK